MISDAILQLCAVSIICGIVLIITPKGSCKTVMQILCTAVLISSIIEPIIDIEFEAYSIQSEKTNEIKETFLQNVNKAEECLSQSVIQQECREYILDKACELGVTQINVSVDVSLNSDGFCVPYASQISACFSCDQKQSLAHIIEKDLGIPEERQTWTHV